MTDTSDAVRLLGPRARKLLALGKLLAVMAAAIVPAISAYRSAAGDGQARAQVVKDKAEAGYQVTKEAYAALEGRVAELERAARATAGDAHRPRGGRHHAPPPAPPPPPVKPRALPPDLDRAERQIYRGVSAPAPGPVQDGGL